MSHGTDSVSVRDFNPRAITRPDRALLGYYIFITVLSNVFSPLVFLPLFFKYETLRYRFDDEGVSMSWGILFRREIYLTYRRIQDIHLTRNILQRWMGLATVSIQTASGSTSPEMAIEGILEADALRDFLDTKMRGARGEHEPQATFEDKSSAPDDEALVLLHEIRDAVKALAAARNA